jgi:hypothetical protein
MSLLSGCIGAPSGSKAWPSRGAFTRTGHLEGASAEMPDASYIPCESAFKVHGCRIELEEQEQPAFPWFKTHEVLSQLVSYVVHSWYLLDGLID